MAETRVTTTSPGQYDLLLAMSQDSVNSALAAMWDVEGDDLTDISVDGSDFGVVGNINAQIGSPDVQVIADGTGRGSVLFRLNFVSGTTKVFDKSVKKAVTIQVKGFKIAFKADIALNDLRAEIVRIDTKLRDSDVDPSRKVELQELKAKTQAKIERFGKQAGDFSIQQLFIDFATADISSLPESELVMPGMKPDQVTAFVYLLQQWLTSNKSSDSTTLGYSLAIDPTKIDNYKVADCLMPTSVVMQTYPYKASPTAQPKLGWSGDAARNSVVYCNMTESRAVGGDPLLQWSGNFITLNADKALRVDGTAVIKKDLFLTRFIVPMLRQFNDDMQIVATTMNITRDGDAGQRRYHWSYDSQLGYNPSYPDWTSPYFQFRENGQGTDLATVNNRDSFNAATSKGFDPVKRADGVSWSWSASTDTGRQENNQDWHFPKDPVNWTDHLSGQNTSFSAVDIVPVPGTGVIKIRGYTEAHVVFDGYYTRLLDSNLEYKGNIGVNAHWQVDIVCSSTEADGMKCAFANQKVILQKYVDEKGVPANESRSWNFVNTLANNIEAMLKNKESICKAINDALNATGKFTHPAAGEFNFRDPIFNRRGDLLVAAEYKAPRKGLMQKVPMPEIGTEIAQRAPGDPGQSVKASGDVTAPIGKKGK